MSGFSIARITEGSSTSDYLRATSDYFLGIFGCPLGRATLPVNVTGLVCITVWRGNFKEVLRQDTLHLFILLVSVAPLVSHEFRLHDGLTREVLERVTGSEFSFIYSFSLVCSAGQCR